MFQFRSSEGKSIESALRFRLLLSLLIVLVITLLLISTLSQNLTRNYVLSRLEHDAESFIAALELGPDDTLIVNEGRIPDIYRRAFSGHYYLITLPEENRIRSRSLWDIELPDQLLTKAVLDPDELIDEQLLLTYRTEVKRHNQLISVWVAEDIHPLAHDTRLFNLSVMSFLLIAFTLLWWLQGHSIRRSFHFFEQLRQRVRALHQGGEENASYASPREIQPLSDEINRLLDQLGQRTERSRTALGNFAHELKRPLQQLQIQKRELPTDQQEKMTDALNQIQYLLDRELKRARIAGRCLPGQMFYPLEDLPPLIQVMQRIYPAISIQSVFPSELTAQDGIRIDRDDTLELLGNLLDNAAKYARSDVTLTLEFLQDSQHSGIVFIIEDNGTGVSPEEQQQLTRRGTKLDESISGHGLGLSICQSICQSYQGELSFGPSDLGGLKVSATLYY